MPKKCKPKDSLVLPTIVEGVDLVASLQATINRLRLEKAEAEAETMRLTELLATRFTGRGAKVLENEGQEPIAYSRRPLTSGAKSTVTGSSKSLNGRAAYPFKIVTCAPGRLELVPVNNK